MRNKVKIFLQSHLRPGDRLIAAVSGGKDSMALLHVLRDLQTELDFSLAAAHFNHQLRGPESQRDQEFVSEICQKWEIPLHLGSGNVAEYAKKNGLGVEEAARILRYEFLQNLDENAKIATAHTAQDNLETVLMRLVRGTGLAGLAGIPPVRGNILRPMLGVSQREIWAYLEENCIPHMEDSTNAQDDCLRNRIRHHVVPLLEQEKPNLSQKISRMTAILRAEDQVLEEIAKPQGTTLDRAALLSLPDVLQYRQMRQFLNIPGVTQGHIQSALDLCRREEPSGCLALPEGCTLVREYENIKLLPKENMEIPQEIRLNSNSTVRFGPWQVTCRKGPRPEKLPPGTVALDPETLDGPLMLRCRQPGDRIRLPGGTKKLARLLIDEKIPARWRDSMPVVTVNGAIAAILPVKAAAFCRPEPGRDSLLLSATRMEDTQ